MPGETTIRGLHDVSEMAACVALQQKVWGYPELETVPDHVFLVAAKTGGQVLAAFDGTTPVGFALSFAALRQGQIYLHSHLVAVLPEYQNRGVGRRLKLAQRDDALARGLDLIEWTFDPFQVKNAYFNISRLGAIARRYVPNLYGRTASPLHHGLPTDRLVAEWWLRSARVRSHLKGQVHAEGLDCERIAVPASIQDLGRGEPQQAEQIRQEVQNRFAGAIAQGRAAVGFVSSENQGLYFMEPYAD